MTDIFLTKQSNTSTNGTSSNRIVLEIEAAQQAGKGTAMSEVFTMIVGITNASFSHLQVLEGIQAWQNVRSQHPNLRLFLFSSLVILEQLGSDKLQAGRVIVFGPTPRDLKKYQMLLPLKSRTI